MLITLDNGKVVSGSELLSATLRTSLEPVPLTFECQIKLNSEYASSLKENSILKVGREQTPVKIVYAQDTVVPFAHRDSTIQVREVIALHENSAGIADALSRAVIRENIGLSDIYRSCGGKSEVEKSFVVPRFYGYIGDFPSKQIARICQEHGGIVRWLPEHNRLSFERIHDLFTQKPKVTKPQNADLTTKSDFLVQNEVPRYLSVAPNGGIIQSQINGNSAIAFVPHKTQAQLNAMSNVILNAKEVPCEFSPDIHAGDLVMLGKVNMVVLTAAHVWQLNDTGVLDNSSVFWLGVRPK